MDIRTLSHVLEPRYPTARERVISLYGYLDERRLAPYLSELSKDFSECARLQERAARFSGAASALAVDIERTARRHLDRDKLTRYLTNLASRLFPKTKKTARWEELRFSGAFTPHGLIDHSSANASAYTECYIFSDKYAASARFALSFLRRQALTAGYDVISCRDPLFPAEGYSSLYVPALSLCILSDGFFTSAKSDNARVVHETRFYDAERLRDNLRRLAFIKKAALGLIDENAALMSEALSVHDRIEKYYSSAADFRGIEKLGCEMIRDILS